MLSASSTLTPVQDPNAPKRGLSAYMFFANDNREKVREDNPGISFGKISLPCAHARETNNLANPFRRPSW